MFTPIFFPCVRFSIYHIPAPQVAAPHSRFLGDSARQPCSAAVNTGGAACGAAWRWRIWTFQARASGPDRLSASNCIGGKRLRIRSESILIPAAAVNRNSPAIHSRRGRPLLWHTAPISIVRSSGLDRPSGVGWSAASPGSFGTPRFLYGSAYHGGWSTLLGPGWARRLLGAPSRVTGDPVRLPVAYGGGKSRWSG